MASDAAKEEDLALTLKWSPHSRLCHLCRVCEQQRSCSPGFRRREMHAGAKALSRFAERGAG